MMIGRPFGRDAVARARGEDHAGACKQKRFVHSHFCGVRGCWRRAVLADRSRAMPTIISSSGAAVSFVMDFVWSRSIAMASPLRIAACSFCTVIVPVPDNTKYISL